MEDVLYVCKNCGYESDCIDDVSRFVYSHDGKGGFKLHPLCPGCGHGLVEKRGMVIVV